MVETITLSIPAADLLAEQLNLAVRQYPLDIPRGGPRERAQVASRVWEELEHNGLARAGRPEPEVEDALYLVCGSELAIAAAGLLDVSTGHRLAARVVATGEVGVVATLDVRGLRMTFLAPDELPWACADLLPNCPPGAGRDVRAVADRSQGVSADTDIAGLAGLTEIAGVPKTRLGHYLVTNTDHRGKRSRVGNLIWFDTARGRYAMWGERSGQADVVQGGPVDRDRLAERLTGMLRRTGGDGPPLR